MIDMTGLRYGKLLVKQRSINNTHNQTTWLCVCDCGTTKVINGRDLRTGNSKSCGCARLASTTIHGQALRRQRTGAYISWQNMHQRCNNPRYIRYKDYGGRGIKVCERWNSFEHFLADMGERPSGMTLDRINNNGNYEPLNCVWATRTEQDANKGR